jgi:hypothetical protein
MHSDKPIRCHQCALFFQSSRSASADDARNVLLQLLAQIFGEPIIPSPKKSGNDRAHAFRSIAMFFSGDICNSLHHAHAVIRIAMRAFFKADILNIFQSFNIHFHPLVIRRAP